MNPSLVTITTKHFAFKKKKIEVFIKIPGTMKKKKIHRASLRLCMLVS